MSVIGLIQWWRPSGLFRIHCCFVMLMWVINVNERSGCPSVERLWLILTLHSQVTVKLLIVSDFTNKVDASNAWVLDLRSLFKCLIITIRIPFRICSNIWKWKYIDYVVHFTGSTRICIHASCVNVSFIIFKTISCRGSHRKQITQRSYTQPIPSIRINGASPPLNGTRQNATEPTGQLNGDISRNKYQAYSPTGKPWLPLALILFKKKEIILLVKYVSWCFIVLLCSHSKYKNQVSLGKILHQCSHEQNHLWQGSGLGGWVLGTYYTKKGKAIQWVGLLLLLNNEGTSFLILGQPNVANNTVCFGTYELKMHHNLQDIYVNINIPNSRTDLSKPFTFMISLIVHLAEIAWKHICWNTFCARE